MNPVNTCCLKLRHLVNHYGNINQAFNSGNESFFSPGLGMLHWLHLSRFPQFMLPHEEQAQSPGPNRPGGPCGTATILALGAAAEEGAASAAEAAAGGAPP